ncbi:MAG TPA: tetratricopeptide repeat protein [Terracidiphilus sp.]|nr:tetratricopeptide repeat protein [Terracidiphilus sp.]
MAKGSLDIESSKGLAGGRLESWKEIAAYLNRDVTTVQRWEKREGMPVHRHLHDQRGSVYALPAELDAWRRTRGSQGDKLAKTDAEPSVSEKIGPARTASGARLRVPIALAVSLLVLAAAYLAFRHRPASQPPAPIHSLAVLPLRNLSGDPSQDYLADGFTEALIDRLAAIHDLRVVSHTSVMRFRNPQLSVPEIARILGVDAVVEGSVIRDGTHVRVTAQLIRGATDDHFWSETYDRELRDALTLESEIAQAIAEKIEVTVTGQEHQRLIAARPVAPEVYESYLKGRFVLEQGSGKAGIEESIGDFNAAIRQDSTFALAYLGLAQAYTDLGTVFGGTPPAETRPRVIAAAQRVLALDPELAEAHNVLANVLQEEWDWAGAEAEYKRALELAPNDARAYAGYALWLSCEGRTDEAVTWVRHARQLDPVAVTGTDVAWILFQAHRYDEAIRETRGALAVQPDNARVLLTLGFALNASHQSGEAVAVLERAFLLSKGSPAVAGVLVRAYALAGRRPDALRLLADLKQRKSAGYVPSAAFVNAYLGLGDNEQAFAALGQAVQEKSNILQFVKTHPYFDPIRSDPRFRDLVRRVGLG